MAELYIVASLAVLSTLILSYKQIKLIYKNVDLTKQNWDQNVKIWRLRNKINDLNNKIHKLENTIDDEFIEHTFEVAFNAGIEHVRVGDDTYQVNETEHKKLLTYIEV